jgi:hypothetical protein
MVKQQLHKTVLVISMAILLLLSTIPSLAQTIDTVELVGIIENMTSTTITVNQQIINLTGAELNIPLEIGSLVKIEGNLSEAGEITAREVNAPDENAQAGEAELVGILESYDGSTMVINGQVVDVATAEVKAGIVIGELVKVHVTANDDGTWQAREAEPTAVPTQDDTTDDNSDDGLRAGEFEIVGTLDEIGDGFVVISGQVIDVSTAEIKNLLVTGVLVKVHLQTVDGVLVAREIENEMGSDDNTNDNSNTNTNDNSSNTNDNNDDNANVNDNTSVDTTVSLEDATSQVLSIYPNTTITEIKLDDDFGGTLIWKIETSHGIEVKIDAQTGVILTIESDGDDNNNGSTNSNDNTSNNNTGDDNSNSSNDNDDDDNNSNSNNDNDDDDNSGMGSDDDDDDNSGMGSDDDDDDNSGMGSDDDDD